MSYIDDILANAVKPETAGFVVGAALTAVVGNLWRRIQNRMCVLRFSSRHTSLARPVDDIFGGKLQVLFRGQELKGVFVTEAYFQNDSATDLENLVLTMEYRNGEKFKGAKGRVSGSSKNLSFSQDFQERVDRCTAANASQSPCADFEYCVKTREFVVPVLNRGATVEVTILTHAENTPRLYAFCNHKGVKVVEEIEQKAVLGVPQLAAAIVGLIASTIGLFFLYPLFDTIGSASFWSFLVGTFVLLIGASVVWVWRMVWKIVSR